MDTCKPAYAARDGTGTMSGPRPCQSYFLLPADNSRICNCAESWMDAGCGMRCWPARVCQIEGRALSRPAQAQIGNENWGWHEKTVEWGIAPAKENATSQRAKWHNGTGCLALKKKS